MDANQRASKNASVSGLQCHYGHASSLQVLSGHNPTTGDPCAVDQHYRNFFVDETVQLAQELLLRKVTTRLSTHSGVGCWNLGNEPDLLCVPPTPADARRWVSRMTRVIHQCDPTGRS